MIEILENIIDFVKDAGYLGIFIMTFVESTFIPIPAEITMIPAGYLVDKGELNMLLVMLFSVIGALGGSYLNYYIAFKYGRSLILKYGKYFFMNEKRLEKMEQYFNKHGNIATFTGRLMPGLRHFISFPAGIARMRLKLFFLYTALGSAIWMFVLMMLGYFIGENELLLKNYLIKIQMVIIVFILITSVFYVYKIFNKKNR